MREPQGDNADDPPWEPLNVRQIFEEIDTAGEKDDKSSGPPGMESSSDDDPEAEAPKAVETETTTDEDDSDYDSDVAE